MAGLAAAASLLAVVAACSTVPKSAQVAVQSQCGAEAAAFNTAASSVATESQSADSYWASVHPAGAAPDAASRQVAADIGAYATRVAQLQTSYAGLRQCRGDHGEASFVAGDVDAAHQAEAAIAKREAVLRGAADRIVAESPTSRVRVAKALAAPPPPAQPYVAVSAATICAKPEDAAAIAELRRGVRVTGPGGDAPQGWTVLTLNDGSLGYVRSEMLRPATLNRSAQIAADQAKKARDGSGDPVVALALAARESLPDRAAAFAALVDASTNPSVALGGPLPGSAR